MFLAVDGGDAVWAVGTPPEYLPQPEPEPEPEPQYEPPTYITYDIPGPYGNSETVVAPPPSPAGELPPVVQEVIRAQEAVIESSVQPDYDGIGNSEAYRRLLTADEQAYKPPGLQENWRNLIDVLKVKAPATSARVQLGADSLIDIFR